MIAHHTCVQREITLRDAAVFASITSEVMARQSCALWNIMRQELNDGKWMGADKAVCAPNIVRMTSNFNAVRSRHYGART